MVIRGGECAIDEKEELIHFYEILSEPNLFYNYLTREIYRYQIELIKNEKISTANLSEEVKRIYDGKTEAAIQYNAFIMKEIEKELLKRQG